MQRKKTEPGGGGEADITLIEEFREGAGGGWVC